MKESIGFIGLGLMGGAIAANLLRAGFRLTGHDLLEEKARALEPLGAEVAASPAEVAERSDIILTCLPNSHVVEEVIFGNEGILDREREGLILIDATTADPAISVRLAQELSGRGISFLDATVSGTARMAQDKDIAVMVGGRREVYERCLPVFEAYARRPIYVGESGAGATIKLVVQLVMGLNRLALAEGLTLGLKAGIDPKLLLEVLGAGAADSRMVKAKGPLMVERRFEPKEGMLKHYFKDIELVLRLGKEHAVPLPMTALMHQLYVSALAHGQEGIDSSSVILIFQKLAAMDREAGT